MATDKRKPTKPRPWSAKRAASLLEVAHGSEFCDGYPPDCNLIDERHLARAYLAGIKAVIDHTSAGDLAEPRVFESVELQRLGMSPKPTGKGRGGKRKSGEGRK